jgi:SOS-response transcriptional repressor LexA
MAHFRPDKDPHNPVPPATFDALVERTVAVLINGEATLKKIRIESANNDYKIHLVPLNADFKPIVIRDSDEVRFQGEVYKTIRHE